MKNSLTTALKEYRKSIEQYFPSPFLFMFLANFEKIPRKIEELVKQLDLFSSNFNSHISEKLLTLSKESQNFSKTLHEEMTNRLKIHNQLKANARTVQEKYYASCNNYIQINRKDLLDSKEGNGDLVKRAKKSRDGLEKEFKDCYVSSAEDVQGLVAGVSELHQRESG